MTVVWRFDQGRLDYFQFDEIKKIAKALDKLDGISKPRSPDLDLIRLGLRKYSNLPFAPDDYFVWRNYKRVFGCQLLATDINNTIYATDLCKVLAHSPDDVDVDDYLAHVSANFYYPSPIFENYSTSGIQVFPMVAIIKWLIFINLTRGEKSVSLDDIAAYLIGNNVTGLEPISNYANLKRTSYVLSGDQPRQLREMLRFISQFSFLKWKNPNLYIDVSDNAALYEIEKSLVPTVNLRQSDAGSEMLQMGSGFKVGLLGALTIRQVELIEQEFAEGKKVRVTHLRTERSSQLKKFYFSNHAHAEICDMCEMDTRKKYPWTDHVIELHHLLPLASPVRLEKNTTSLKDLVGLCPTCHRATHKHYSRWLNENKVNDFRDYAEAKDVYLDVKKSIILI
jgi:hypothetical protein